MTGYSDPDIVYTHVASGAIELWTGHDGSGSDMRRILCHPTARDALDRFLEMARELDRDPIDLLIEELPEGCAQRDPSIPRDMWPVSE